MKNSTTLIALLFFAVSPVSADVKSDLVSYSRDVLPILAENCFACHGFDEQAREADLRLDNVAGATESVIVPGDVEASELIARVTSNDADVVMPPPESEKRLTDKQRETLKRWIQQGARYETHWSFIAPKRPELPEVADISHPIDRFIQSQLIKRKLSPSPLADNATMMRRVYLDLIGLPPKPEEVKAFETAANRNLQAAWHELVDRLLKSPHYGERWGRWWLDQARYADSNGYSVDAPRSIWKYRDWVIESLNRDMPFDQFTIEQIAGDLLPDATTSQKVATGFHRNTQINQEGGIDREQYRIDSVFDRVATTGTVWLGLTIGCAQCHDHKFDPIKQKEFYQLFAFLNNQDEPSIKVYPPEVDSQAISQQRKNTETTLKLLLEQYAEQVATWEKELNDETRKNLPDAVKNGLKTEDSKRKFDARLTILAHVVQLNNKDDELENLRRDYARLGKVLNDAPSTMVLQERAAPRETHLLIKGDFTRKADQVWPGTPAVLHALTTENEHPNRLDLARWITDPQNPLTARVIVNRIWQQYFGRGLVATENDFGLLGSIPSHPELLDWLATELIEKGWSLKEIHRLIVTSHTYRQSSKVREDLKQADPDNFLLGRQLRIRLDAEIVRDVVLDASGLLVPKLGGPPVFPPIPDGVMNQGQVNRAWKVSQGDDRYRRGLYTFIYRATPPPSMQVFDAPDGYSTCTHRNRSNTPLQSLTLMNNAAFFECAQSLEKIIKRDGLESAFRRCTSRLPGDDELAILKRLDTLTAARALLNLDETITRE